MNAEEDNLIMQRVSQGDLAGIDVLFERYHVQLLRYFRGLCGDQRTSEDLTQETFWRIIRYRRTFRPDRPFRAWMYQIARNLFYNHARKSANEQKVFANMPCDAAEASNGSECEARARLERSERAGMLQTALSRLPDDKRELIVLCRFQETPQAEIAQLMGCSVGALKVRLFRALQDLKQLVLEMEKEYVS